MKHTADFTDRVEPMEKRIRKMAQPYPAKPLKIMGAIGGSNPGHADTNTGRDFLGCLGGGVSLNTNDRHMGEIPRRDSWSFNFC